MRSGRGGRRHCGEQFGLWRRLLAAALPSILITPGVGLIAAPSKPSPGLQATAMSTIGSLDPQHSPSKQMRCPSCRSVTGP